jgi:hypothetical protein
MGTPIARPTLNKIAQMLLSWSSLLGEEDGLVYVSSMIVSIFYGARYVRMHYCIIVWAGALDINIYNGVVRTILMESGCF